MLLLHCLLILAEYISTVDLLQRLFKDTTTLKQRLFLKFDYRKGIVNTQIKPFPLKDTTSIKLNTNYHKT